MAMLFESWEAFISAYDEASRNPPLWTVHLRQEDAPEEDSRIAEFVRLASNPDISISEAARRVGVTPTTGVRWAKLHFIPYQSRTKALTPQFLERVRRLLRRGSTKSQVMTDTRISATSLTRLISSEPTLRAQWNSARLEIARRKSRESFLKAVENHPGLPVKALRMIPGNGYQWLYRHDRQWLVEHLPSLWRAPVPGPEPSGGDEGT
jgi:transposase-like protein